MSIFMTIDEYFQIDLFEKCIILVFFTKALPTFFYGQHFLFDLHSFD